MLAAVGCPTIVAQMRGGAHVGGRPAAGGIRGPHSGFVAGPRGPRVGFVGGPRAGMDPRGRFIPPSHFGPNRFVGRPVPAFPPGFHGNRFAPTRFGFVPTRFGFGFGHHHSNFFFGAGCFGPFFNPFACQGAFFGAPAFWPGPVFWPDTTINYTTSAYPYTTPYSYAPDPNYAVPDPNYAPSAETQQANADLRADVERLSDEVDLLRQEQQARSAPSTSTTEQPTVLIFRNGERREIHNYGIVGQTLWIFTDQRATKVPLADLDLRATQEANAQRGVEFLWHNK